MGLVDLERAGHLFHGFHLGAAAYAGHADAHIHGRPHALVEQALLQVNLTVGDGNHIGGNVGRHVAGLRLDDGKGRQRTAAAHLVFQDGGKVVHLRRHFLLVDDAGGALQQTAVQIENISRIGLAAGGAAQNQGHFAVGHGLFGEVVIHYQGMAARIAEILADGRPRKRSVILQGRRIGRRGSHHRGVIHGPVLPQRLHDGRHGGTLLADGHIDAVHRFSGLVGGTLVDDSVDGDGRLACLAVSDDELALPAADGNHGVDGLEARLQRLRHRLAEDDPGRLALQRHVHLLPFDGAQAVQRIAQRVDHSAQQIVIHADGGDAAGPAHHHSFLHVVCRPHQDGAHIVGFQVHHHGHQSTAAVQQFAGLGMVQAIDAHHAVTHLQGLADLLETEIVFHVFELPEQDIADFAGFQGCICH